MAESVIYILQIRDRFEKNLKKFNKQMNVADKNTAKLRQRLNKLSVSAASAGRTLSARVTLPIVALGTASVFAFSKMEAGLTDVLNLLEKDQVDKFGGDLLAAQKAAIKMGFSITDTNKALFDTVSALGIGDKAFETFAISQKLAIAGATDIGIAVDGITSIVNAYGKEITNATEVSNAFFSGQVKGKTTVAELASTVGQLAPIARDAGVGFKEMIATISGLTVGGLSTEESVTSLKGAIIALTKPGKEAEKILTALGIPFGKTQIRAAGLRKTLELLIKANEKFPDAVTRAIPNIRASTAILALNEEKLKLVDSALLKMTNDFKNGTGQQEAFNRKMLDTTQKLKEAKGEITLASREIGAVLAPFVVKASKKVSELADRFSNLSPATKKWIVILAGIAAVVGPLLIVFSSMISIFSGLAVASAALGISLGWMLAIPIAIAAVIAGVVFLQKKFGILTKTGDFLKRNFRLIAAAILFIMGPIGLIIGALIVLQKRFDFLGKIGDFVGNNLKTIGRFMLLALGPIGVLINVLIELEKRFQFLSKIGNFANKIIGKAFGEKPNPEALNSNQSSLTFPGITRDIRVNNTPGLSQQIARPTPQSNSVDVSGQIKVIAEKGTVIQEAKVFSPDVGINLTQSF